MIQEYSKVDPGPNGEGNVEVTRARPRFSQSEVEGVCGRLSLSSVSLGRYLVVMRSGFDVVIAGEPYLALMLLLELDSGKFLTRIWNQTITRGRALTLEGLVEACETFFARSGRPCLGLPEDEDEQVMQDFLVSQTPVPRKLSKACRRVLGRDEGEVPSCAECFKLRDIKSLTLAPAAADDDVVGVEFIDGEELKTEVVSGDEEEVMVEAPPKAKKKRQRPRKDVNYFAEVEKKRRKRSDTSYHEDEENEEPYIDVNSYLEDDRGRSGRDVSFICQAPSISYSIDILQFKSCLFPCQAEARSTPPFDI